MVMFVSDVKWIKITTDIFDDEKILLIESMPDAYAIIIVWFKLLCFAGKQNNSGVFKMGNIAYTGKMLATIFRMKETTVQLALDTFEQFGMIDIVDGVITIRNWGKHQKLDHLESKKAYMQNYMQEYRKKQMALISCKTNSKANVSRTDIDTDTEKEIDSISVSPGEAGEEKNAALHRSIIEYLNERAGTQYKASNAKTKSSINARLADGFTEDDFRTVIDKKCSEWIGTEWARFLRPSTLFGTKFEEYLHTPQRAAQNAQKPSSAVFENQSYDTDSALLEALTRTYGSKAQNVEKQLRGSEDPTQYAEKMIQKQGDI